MLGHVERKYAKLLDSNITYTTDKPEVIVIDLTKLACFIISDKAKFDSNGTYLVKYYQSLENNLVCILVTDVVRYSRAVFELYQNIKFLNKQYNYSYPRLRKRFYDIEYHVKEWFRDFIIAWLEEQEKRIKGWLRHVIETENYDRTPNKQYPTPYTYSVVDLFKMFTEKLEYFKRYEWPDKDQYQEFLWKFTKIVTTITHSYVDSLVIGEIKRKKVYSFTNIDVKTCVKLCNVEEVIVRLTELRRLINKEDINKGKSPNLSNVRAKDGTITGKFSIKVVFAQNLMPCQDNGLSNPYLVVKIPEGAIRHTRNNDRYNQQNLELAKTTVIHDSVNPEWNETLQISLPPTKYIDFEVYHKNSFLHQDKLCGRKSIRLSSNWCDHLYHDIYVNLQPQGLLKIRIKMNGECKGDIDYRYRELRENIVTTFIDFIRCINHHISLTIREELVNACKKNETSQHNWSLFQDSSKLTTSSGQPVNKELTSSEFDKIFRPLDDYLNKNLDVIYNHTKGKMVDEIIFSIWSDAIKTFINLMVPSLYGNVERDRQILNPRQISFIKLALDELFFLFLSKSRHLTMNKLRDAPRYNSLYILLNKYESNLNELKKYYEATGKKQQVILRLIRLYSIVGEDSNQREDARAYVNAELKRIDHERNRR